MLVLIAGFLDFVSLKLALVCVPEIRGDIDLEGFFRDLYKSALGNSEVGNRRTSRVLAAGVVQSVVLALGNKQLQLAGLVQCVHAEVEKCWQRRDQESDLLTDEQLKPCIVDSLLAWCRKSFLDAGNVPSAPTVVQRLVGCASLSDLAARLVYILAEAKAKQTRKPRKQREHAEAQAKQTREPREQREQFWLRCAFHVTQSLERFWERRYHQLLTEVNEQRRLEKKVANAEQKKAKAKAKAEAKAKANGTVIVAAPAPAHVPRSQPPRLVRARMPALRADAPRNRRRDRRRGRDAVDRAEQLLAMSAADEAEETKEHESDEAEGDVEVVSESEGEQDEPDGTKMRPEPDPLGMTQAHMAEFMQVCSRLQGFVRSVPDLEAEGAQEAHCWTDEAEEQADNDDAVVQNDDKEREPHNLKVTLCGHVVA